MVWKILGVLLVMSCIGNIGLGNFPVAIIAALLAWACFNKAKKNQEKGGSSTPVQVGSSVKNASSRSVTPAKQAVQPVKTAVTPVDDDEVPAEDRISGVLALSFPEYTYKRNVDFASLTTQWWVCSCGAENNGSFCCECGNPKPTNTEWTCSCGCRNTSKFCADCGKSKPAATVYEPIDFLVMRDGMPKLAILLVDRKYWNTKPIRSTIQACEAAGIPWQRYFVEFTNEVNYVTNRIRSDLR